ncbi:hypothetical protein [Synechococcus sp. LTW-R]|uniref:hypothetical protein n=1 Tax=Synechococcus sp. LTW-R TaxID=2751170 RepID=UPI0016249D2E|nr:hypothetical protein [Synechococcus sp. LTW-R]QNG29300.1 hypothetical protein H0O22_11330 [Synechococcus sp. LTW-R]
MAGILDRHSAAWGNHGDECPRGFTKLYAANHPEYPFYGAGKETIRIHELQCLDNDSAITYGGNKRVLTIERILFEYIDNPVVQQYYAYWHQANCTAGTYDIESFYDVGNGYLNKYPLPGAEESSYKAVTKLSSWFVDSASPYEPNFKMVMISNITPVIKYLCPSIGSVDSSFKLQGGYPAEHGGRPAYIRR